MKIAVMQPYLFPYAGYYRLLKQTDLFVVYDCVQFPRRGYVHRAKYELKNKGATKWLTLPLNKCEVSTKINELSYSTDHQAVWKDRVQTLLKQISLKNANQEFIGSFTELGTKPLDYLIRQLSNVSELLNIPFNITYSSTLKVPESFKGQDRILEICKRLGANEYLNSPGGKHLYDHKTFTNNNIKLNFLPEFQGNYNCILARILNNEVSLVKNELSTT